MRKAFFLFLCIAAVSFTAKAQIFSFSPAYTYAPGIGSGMDLEFFFHRNYNFHIGAGYNYFFPETETQQGQSIRTTVHKVDLMARAGLYPIPFSEKTEFFFTGGLSYMVEKNEVSDLNESLVNTESSPGVSVAAGLTYELLRNLYPFVKSEFYIGTRSGFLFNAGLLLRWKTE